MASSSTACSKLLFDLTGKTALITGASSGLGRAMATALASVGCHVVLAARRVDKLKEATDDIQRVTQKSCSVSVVPADVSSYEGIEQLAGTVRSQMPPDILINAAGVNFRQPSSDVTPDTWERTLFLNLTTPYFLSKAFIPNMQEKGWGKIVNVASLQSVRAFPDSIPYGASKGGVAQLTRAMAEEYSQLGITVNALGPGFFPTELTAKLFDDDNVSARLATQTCIGRNGRLEDIYGPTIFLSSPASDYVTGQVLFVDGGFTAK
jgi:gluconate 5-dehydrogenase